MIIFRVLVSGELLDLAYNPINLLGSRVRGEGLRARELRGCLLVFLGSYYRELPFKNYY